MRALVIVALAPIFLAACGPVGGGTALAPVAGPTFEAPGPPVAPVPPWQVQAYASVSPTTTAAAATSTTTAPVTSTATALPSATVTPGPCLPLDGPNGGPTMSATTVKGTGTITVSWYDNGDPATKDYQVGIIVPTQLQPSPSPSATSWTSPMPEIKPNWTMVAALADCQILSTKLTGVAPGIYDLYLDRESLTPEFAPRTITRTTLSSVHALTVS